jgi:hypothetical protein
VEPARQHHYFLVHNMESNFASFNEAQSLTTATESTLDLLLRLYPLFVGIEVAAEIIGVSPQTLRNRISNHSCQFPTIKEGTRRRVDIREIAKFIDARTVACREVPVPSRRKVGRPPKSVEIARRREVA